PPQATYLFKHALVQDAAYGTLLRSRRQQLHASIAAGPRTSFLRRRDRRTCAFGSPLHGSWVGGESKRLLAAGRSAGACTVCDDGSGRTVAKGTPGSRWPARRPVAGPTGAGLANRARTGAGREQGPIG